MVSSVITPMRTLGESPIVDYQIAKPLADRGVVGSQGLGFIGAGDGAPADAKQGSDGRSKPQGRNGDQEPPSGQPDGDRPHLRGQA